MLPSAWRAVDPGSVLEYKHYSNCKFQLDWLWTKARHPLTIEHLHQQLWLVAVPQHYTVNVVKGSGSWTGYFRPCLKTPPTLTYMGRVKYRATPYEHTCVCNHPRSRMNNTYLIDCTDIFLRTYRGWYTPLTSKNISFVKTRLELAYSFILLKWTY